MAHLEPTCEPSTFIEERREDYIRYINDKGNRWEVFGKCTDIGECYKGAAGPKPELDCPVTIFFRDNCCPLKVKELETIIIPALDEKCIAAQVLRSFKIPFQLRVMKDEYSYGKLMQEVWRERHPVIIIEHDIVVFPEAIENICACDHPYCGYYYHIAGKLGGTLGFTKFSREIMTKVPIDFTHVHWQEVDKKIADEFLKFGIEDFHRHYPSVTHIKNGNEIVFS